MNKSLKIFKFGGSSLADSDKLKIVAEKIKSSISDSNIIVVVSANGNFTNELLNKKSDFTTSNNHRELDVILSTGEMISSALLCMKLEEIGIRAKSFNAYQARIITDKNFNNAFIKEIEGSEKILRTVSDGIIPVITGFQGITKDGELTTIGRGGSDTTAVALAHALGAEECILYSDVAGVYTADPRIVKNARLLSKICYDEMSELAHSGAKVINHRALELSRKFGIKLIVRSSFDNGEGTLIDEEGDVEKTVISGITHNKNSAKISIFGISQKDGTSLKIMNEISNNEIPVEMIMQNITYDGLENLNIIVSKEHIISAISSIEKFSTNFERLIYDADVGSVSIVGRGLKEKSGIIYKMLNLISAENIPVYMVSSSEIKVIFIINASDVERVVLLLHEGLELDK
jgi:aspartate kinase